MNFCKQCDNMYYIKINPDKEDQLIYYCRNCGSEESNIDQNTYVVKNKLKRQDNKYFNIINEYTKFDPTLPRINNIPCPNAECISNKEKTKKNEIILIRYDDKNLNFVYLCSHCDTLWKSVDN